MKTNSIHIVSAIVLALVLISLGSSQSASAYPAGAAISTGTNPVVGFTDYHSTEPYATTGVLSVGSAPSDQDIILTDIVIQPSTNDFDCIDRIHFTLKASGVAIANIISHTPFLDYDGASSMYGNANTAFQMALQSGLRVPAGAAVTLEFERTDEWADCWSARTIRISYTMTGYYAQP